MCLSIVWYRLLSSTQYARRKKLGFGTLYAFIWNVAQHGIRDIWHRPGYPSPSWGIHTERARWTMLQKPLGALTMSIRKEEDSVQKYSSGQYKKGKSRRRKEKETGQWYRRLTFMTPYFLRFSFYRGIVIDKFPNDIWETVLCVVEKRLQVILPSWSWFLCCLEKSRRPLGCLSRHCDHWETWMFL